MAEKFKHRYAPGPYGNAVQDTPRTFNEEIGVKDRDYWSTRKEEREGGSHAGRKEASAYGQRIAPARRRIFKYGPPKKYPEAGKYKAPKRKKGFKRRDKLAPAKSGFGKVKGKLKSYQFKPREKPSKVTATYTTTSPAQEHRIKEL